jgi:hypothetical protein
MHLPELEDLLAVGTEQDEVAVVGLLAAVGDARVLAHGSILPDRPAKRCLVSRVH